MNKEQQGYESGVIYRTGMLKYYKMKARGQDDLANDYLVTMCETALGMPQTADNPMVEYMMTELEFLADQNHQKIERKKQQKREEKIDKMQLDDIARLIYKEGLTQSEVGKVLQIPQQTVSYRVGIIRSEFPELRQKYDSTLPILLNLPIGTNEDFSNTNLTNFTKNTNGTNEYIGKVGEDTNLPNYQNYQLYQNNVNVNVNDNVNVNKDVSEEFSFLNFKKKVYVCSYDGEECTGQELLDSYNFKDQSEIEEMRNEFPDAYDDLIKCGVIQKKWEF